LLFLARLVGGKNKKRNAKEGRKIKGLKLGRRVLFNPARQNKSHVFIFISSTFLGLCDVMMIIIITVPPSVFTARAFPAPLCICEAPEFSVRTGHI